MNCPYCQDEQQQVKAGRTASGKQRYKCKQCRRRYTYHAIAWLDAKKVIYKKSLSEYETGMNHFFDQLFQLNTNIYVMEHIFAFPFALFAFTAPHENTFFRAVIRNFFDASILTITRLATDKNNDFYTLPQFKNWLLRNIKKKYRPAFQAQLKNATFDVTTNEMLKKARDIRDTRIAHLKRDYVDGTLQLKITYLDDLKNLRDLLNRQLRDTLAFNVDYRMLPLQYDPRVQHPVGSDSRPDIEKVLDLIARDSYLLNMPENHPDRWSYQKKRLSTDELNQLNYYRRKFALREV